jgi:hypothetical protein
VAISSFKLHARPLRVYEFGRTDYLIIFGMVLYCLVTPSDHDNVIPSGIFAMALRLDDTITILDCVDVL